jgi:tryptophan 2,3-dioxygenase
MAEARAIDPTYWEYIRLDRLLSLQGGVDAGEGDVATADELHFIVIHQAIELLFKLVLRELRETREALGQEHIEENRIPEVAQHLARVNEAIGVTCAHFGFMETLGTQGFLSFRDKLGSSSGAQSFQMRELEELLGLPRAERERVLRRLRAELPDPEVADGFEGFVLEPLAAIVRRLERQIAHKRELGADDGPDRFALAAVERAQADIAERGSLRMSLERWLYRTPVCGSAPPAADTEAIGVPALEEDRAKVRAFVDDYLARGRAAGWSEGQVHGAERLLRGAPDAPLTWFEERVRAALLFIETYSDLPLLAWPRLLLDRLVELEARLVDFRNGHARMVERVIGDRPGTGGSVGIKYLDLTRDARVFPELVQIRGALIPRQHRWAFPGIERYDFASPP